MGLLTPVNVSFALPPPSFLPTYKFGILLRIEAYNFLHPKMRRVTDLPLSCRSDPPHGTRAGTLIGLPH